MISENSVSLVIPSMSKFRISASLLEKFNFGKSLSIVVFKFVVADIIVVMIVVVIGVVASVAIVFAVSLADIVAVVVVAVVINKTSLSSN